MSELTCACGMEMLPSREWTVYTDACGCCMTEDADIAHEYECCTIARGTERGES